MKRITLSFITLFFTLCPLKAAAPSTLPNFLLTSELREYLSSEEKPNYLFGVGYVIGVVDAGLLRSAGADKQPLRDCLTPMKIGQIAAIVKKQIESHPEHWEEPAAHGVQESIRLSCGELGYK